MAEPGIRPPPSPTASWRHTIVGKEYTAEQSDTSRHPYLPDPYPLKRRQLQRDGSLPGFQSLREPLRPPRKPDPVYSTYAQWWQDQRPASGQHDDSEDKKFSTSFWPYGRRVSAVAPTDHEDANYMLDGRVIKNAATYAHKRDPRSYDAPPTPLARSHSAAGLFGSGAEAFGYSQGFGSRSLGCSRSLGRTDSSVYPPNAPRKRQLEFGLPLPEQKPRTPNETSPSEAGTARSREVATTPPSQQARSQAGNTRYVHQNLRERGFGQRTFSEWRLPQAEDVKRAPGL